MIIESIALIFVLGIYIAFLYYTRETSPTTHSKCEPRPFVVDGVNTHSNAQNWFIEDISLAKHKVLIVTSTGQDNFWGKNEIVSVIREAAGRKVQVIFIVGPPFEEAIKSLDPMLQNLSLRRLADEEVIELRILEENACADLWLIDNNGTYTCYPESTNPKNDSRPYLRTWSQFDVAQKQKELVREYFLKSKIYPKNKLFSAGLNAA